MTRSLSRAATILLSLCATAGFAGAQATTQSAAAPPPRMVASGPATRYVQYEEARRLEGEDKRHEAFTLYLQVPGAEESAARLARQNPQEYLPLAEAALATAGDPALEARILVVQGDLILALGKNAEALACYRKAAGQMPADDYPVELSASQDWRPGRTLLSPFELGPGSHRDNWLIRRFIALEAWDDAGREFARIWKIHSAGDAPVSTVGLQFAIDYAYFLTRQKDPAGALGVLRLPLLRLDMDHQPPVLNVEGAARSRWGGVAGISRKEFVRLAYGEFKSAGKENELLAAVDRQIQDGRNQARRVLARLRMQQGQLDGALALELAYIDSAQFNDVTTAYRRGLIDEDYKKLPEAAAEYEKFLALPSGPVSAPDPDEQPADMRSAVAIHDFPPEGPIRRDDLRPDVIDRLLRLDGALARTDKVLELTLTRLELNDRLVNVSMLEQAGQQFRTAGKEADFKVWLVKRADAVKVPAARAAILWQLGEREKTIAALLDAAREYKESGWLLDEWKRRFAEAGKKPLNDFLLAMLEANPKDVRARLEWLDSQERLEGPAVVSAMEAVLDPDTTQAWDAVRYSRGREMRLKDPYELAYRLMRLYERAGDVLKLQALALRMARMDKPFPRLDRDQYSHRDRNDVPELAHAALSLAIELADEKSFASLNEALKDSPWGPARGQLSRRAGVWPAAAESKAFAWANLPAGVRLLASNENVLSLCQDAKYLYAGHPWGVAVYTHQGQPVVRVAIATAGLNMTALNGFLWVGSPVGLYRIEIGKWGVAYLACDQDLPPAERADSQFFDFHNGVLATAAQGDMLWIGARRNIQRLNTKTGELRIFNNDELLVSSHADWRRFLFDGNYVWAAGDYGCRRYDPDTDSWQAPQVPSAGMLAMVDGVLWGQAIVNEKIGLRPCIIDRKTLAVSTVLLDEKLSPGQQPVTGVFAYYGKLGGRPVFGMGAPGWAFDPEAKVLRPLRGPSSTQPAPVPDQSDGLLLEAMRGQHPWTQPDGTVVGETTGCALKLPDGTWAVGRRANQTRYQYPKEDWPFDRYEQERRQAMGGLLFVSPDGKQRHVSAEPLADSLASDEVFFALEDKTDPKGGHVWLGSTLGVAVLDADWRVQARIDRAGGLIGNRVVSAAAMDGRLYFGSAWGDSGGGLMVYNPGSMVFTALLSPDGLATDKLDAVSVEGDHLKLTYGVEYRRYSDGRYQQYPPGQYTPSSRTFSPPGEPQILTDSAAQQAALAARGGPMAYLGGFAIRQQTIGGKTVVCGTRGVIISDAADVPALAIGQVESKLLPNQLFQQALAAQGRQANIKSPADLEKLLKDPNPYLRTQALAFVAAVWAKDNRYFAVLGQATRDPFVPARRAAMAVAANSPGPEAKPALMRGLSDADGQVRTAATLGLARLGDPPDLPFMEESLQQFGNSYYTSGSALYEALAPRLTEKTIALLMKYPLPADDYEDRQRILKVMGQALSDYPAAVPVLLTAYDSDNSGVGRVRFVQGIFRHADKALLPVLHKALQSPDRIIRSNAARACGAMGDAASIGPLIAALDLESGLARASIVWALGELKAKESLPQMAGLYVDARNDEQRRAGSGFRFAQAAAEMSNQYENLSSLSALGGDWDELKAAAVSPGIDPRRNEPLLTPQDILEAVRKIGPAASQEFYRALAGERDQEGRVEAARWLAEGNEEDRARNVPILNALLGDGYPPVKVEAAVSLVILDQESGRAALRQLLAGEGWQRSAALHALARVRDPKKLQFAEKELGACAGDLSLGDPTRGIARGILANLR